MINKTKGRAFIIIGVVLIMAALSLTGYYVWEDRKAGMQSEMVNGKLADAEIDTMNRPVIPDYILNPNMEMPTRMINGYSYIATLDIPALDLHLPVMEEWDYERLRISPCRYSGTAYLGNMVICGHNYESHFGRLSSLLPGDKVMLTDMDGNEFNYEVAEVTTLNPTSVSAMTESEWELTLFTCTLSGMMRVTVRCDQIDDDQYAVPKEVYQR